MHDSRGTGRDVEDANIPGPDARREDPEFALLMTSTQGGCSQSFKRLYELTGPPLLGVILRINRNRDDAEEILQDVFVSAWMRCGQFDVERGSVMAWLASIAHHKAVSSLRHRSARLKSASDSSAQPEDNECAAIPSEDRQPLASLAQARAASALHACLDALSDDHRCSLVMAFFDDLTHAEIALRLGRPIGTVKSWLRRSMLSMRPLLAEH